MQKNIRKWQKMTSKDQTLPIQSFSIELPKNPLKAFIHRDNHFPCKTMSQLNHPHPRHSPQALTRPPTTSTPPPLPQHAQASQVRQNDPSEKYNWNEESGLKEEALRPAMEGGIKKTAFETTKIKIHELINIKEKSIHEEYELLEKIGQGTYGQVFRGVSKISREERAIKVIKRRLMSEQKTKQFLAETSLLKKISHPSIVRVYELFQHENNFYVVLQYCKGGSLQASLKDIKFKPEHMAATIMKQVLAGLAYLHSLNIVHRDIKGDNIVFLDPVSSRGPHDYMPVKIIDFGTAVQLSYKIEHNNSIAGTLAYLSPESFKGIISQKSDIWSSAVLMITLLTGVNPLAGSNQKQTQNNIIQKVLNFYQKPFSVVSDDAKDLLQKMFERNLHKRPSAGDLLRHRWFDLARAQGADLLTLRQLEGYQKRNNLISIIECYVTLRRLSQPERQKIAQLFFEIDKDNSGFLDKDEFLAVFRSISPCTEEGQLRRIIDLIDKDKSGKIDFNEFLVAMADKNSMFMQESLEEAFEYFDADKTGFLEKAELKSIMGSCPKKQVEYFISRLDTNKDQLISKQEFIQYLSSC